MENGGLRWEGGGGGQCRPLLSLGKEHIVSPRLGLAFWGGNLRGGVPTEDGAPAEGPWQPLEQSLNFTFKAALPKNLFIDCE